jgi:UDP-glucuronate 4-epimerase
MSVLVTGAAGFIGFHVSKALLARGDEVVGVDNLNPYYEPRLKHARLEVLNPMPGFRFHHADIADEDAIRTVLETSPAVDRLVHLAAQAGVRHSLEKPFDYVESNLKGHMVILEACRHAIPGLKHCVYASSSSVYGGNDTIPFSVDDRVDRPVSLYAATKRANELMSQCYAHLFGIPQTGLRFFTVYGPYGRPDMAAYIFTDAITHRRPITLFNEGRMERDFTFIDDIVDGVLRALDRPPPTGEGAPHRVYNLGNHRPTPLRRFVEIIEQALQLKAEIRHAPLPPGDVVQTYADIEASTRDLGFEPRTGIEDGINRFVTWYREYHGA